MKYIDNMNNSSYKLNTMYHKKLVKTNTRKKCWKESRNKYLNTAHALRSNVKYTYKYYCMWYNIPKADTTIQLNARAEE